MSRNIHVDTGSYTGNGTSQSISIGWQPVEVILVSERTTGPTGGRAMAFKDSSMPDDDYLRCANTTAMETANGLTLTADGFSVGSDQLVNNSGTVFHWIAFRQSSWAEVVTYTGDGVGAGQAVTTGRQPIRVRVAQTTGTARLVQKLSQTGTVAQIYTTTAANLDPGITMQSTGFLAQQDANTTGESYSAAVMYPTSGSTQHMEEGSYVGDGGTQAITLGKQPKAVLIYNSSNPRIFLKTSTMAADAHGEIASAYSWSSPGEITITSTGFSVTGNANGSTDSIRYLAIFN